MERAKVSASGAAAAAVAAAAAAEKRKKFEESKESRIDAKQVIDELIKSANLEHDESEQGEQHVGSSACSGRCHLFRLFCFRSLRIAAERHHETRTSSVGRQWTQIGFWKRMVMRGRVSFPFPVSLSPAHHPAALVRSSAWFVDRRRIATRIRSASVQTTIFQMKRKKNKKKNRRRRKTSGER